MTRPTVVVLCEHGEAKPHRFGSWDPPARTDCPGGRVLQQAIVWWCEEHRAGESAEEGTCEVAAALLTFSNYSNHCQMVETLLAPMDALDSAQENQP